MITGDTLRYEGDDRNGEVLSHLKLTCISHTASLSPSDIALYTAAPRVEINSGSLVGGEFSLNVSLQPIILTTMSAVHSKQAWKLSSYNKISI